MDDSALADLLEAIGQNDNFKMYQFYVLSFGTYPSTLRLNLQVDGTKESTADIINQLELEQNNFKTVIKNWRTENSKDAKLDDDYVYEYILKSESRQMLIHLLSQRKMMQIHFLYNHEDSATEQWILEKNHSLRTKYGHEKKPGFKVLVSSEGRFYTDDIDTVDFQSVDINELYNDDFAEIDEVISESIQKTESGMILLHGDPGTGKTTYIKHLICKHQDKQFIFIQNDFVRDLLNPSFVYFLLQNKNCILLIEDAEKVVVSRESSSSDSVVSTILQLTDGLFSDYLNIKIICTFNTNIERIDKALLRKGRMIAKYKFTALSAQKTVALANKLGFEDVKGSMTLADIFGLDKKDFKDPEKKNIGFSD